MPYYSNVIKRDFGFLISKVKDSVYKPVAQLEVTAWVTPEPVPFHERYSGEKKNLVPGQSWGNLWDCAWFHFTGTVPETASGKHTVLLIDLSGEACIVDEDGCPVQGLTTVSSAFEASLGKPGKKVVRLYQEAKGGEKVDLWADAGCNDLFGGYRDRGMLMEACIAVCNTEMEQLYYDFEVLYELLDNLPEEKARYHSILHTLNEASKVLHHFTEEEAKKAREILSKELEKRCGDPSLTISAIGHAHIDLAWLWPIRETIRKGARTFSTALKNMERYPDYVFGASQPQLYQWMKEYYPSLYEKVKARIAEGRWEAQGAMWVEPDTNMAGGEALVRQVLYGKRFFREEFGKDIKVLWLPDVFGYTAALPQILKKSGVDYFMTIKLSWSKFNKHPHHTFWWEGLDGTRILAHMPPEGTYNSAAAPRSIHATEKEFLDKGISDRCLLLFGIGDGGGGPGEEHLERLAREKDLNGLVPVVQEPSIDFFKKIEKDASKFKVWHGELYLEFHQGTYTSQARNKRMNRKLEVALRELEFASAQAMCLFGTGYPQEELEKIWKEMLLYQFHDILPGSSIQRVYDESLERYRILLDRVKELTGNAYSAIAGKVDTAGVTRPAVAFNSLSWERTEWILHQGQWFKAKVPPMGCTVIDLDQKPEAPVPVIAQGDVLENDKLRLTFFKDGSLQSVYDKESRREVIAPGEAANRLTVYEDEGNAWDFTIQYDEKPGEDFRLIETVSLVDGPRAVRKSKYIYGQSTLTQEVVLVEGSRRIDFSTTVDWKETHKMLRTSFPVDIFATEADCEIQFGNIKRPTHRNTSWDMAKYEICAHKWVDLSQRDYGVALLNDCKYGYKVLGHTLDLNLLRSTGEPDPVADRAVHEFTYSLFPHRGDYADGGVVREGYALNMPITILTAVPGQPGGFAPDKPFITVGCENIVVETVKKSEDNRDLIIRLYECHGAGVTAGIKLGFPAKTVRLVNLMEEAIDGASLNCENLKLTFKPFEIQTLRIEI